MKKRMTLQDIADVTGLTRMTVSRYLRDPNQVSQKSREIISAAMEAHHYIPNRAPEILFTSRSKTIGIIIPSFQNHIFSDLLAGVQQTAAAFQYQTIISNSEYDPEREEQQIINLLSYNIDALLLTDKSHTPRALNYLKSAGIPIAELMDINDDFLDIQVGFDNQQAAMDVAALLLARDKKRITFIGSMHDARDIKRFAGLQKALAAQGLAASYIAPGEISSIPLGRKLFRQMLTRYPETDAVFCTNDDLAVGVLLECQARGIRVPEQIAIVGFHGLDVSQANLCQIATVITPRFDIGRVAAELVINRLDNKKSATSVRLDYQIVSGDTL